MLASGVAGAIDEAPQFVKALFGEGVWGEVLGQQAGGVGATLDRVPEEVRDADARGSRDGVRDDPIEDTGSSSEAAHDVPDFNDSFCARVHGLTRHREQVFPLADL